jgi:hypothetical protein
MIGAAIRVVKNTSSGEIFEPVVAPGRKTMRGADVARAPAGHAKVWLLRFFQYAWSYDWFSNASTAMKMPASKSLIASYNRQLCRFPCF